MYKILVVDDEPAIRQLYRCEFEELGYRVHTTGDPAAALRALRDWRPDIVLLDIRLGKHNGLEVLRHMRAREPRLPAVIVTAYCGYRDDFTSWLADAFVTKSGDLTELKRVVATLLAESELQHCGD
jgi:CheY-like chemotaxis protein